MEALAISILVLQARLERLPKKSLRYIYDWVDLLSEKTMAPHLSTLAWKIPWMEEPGGLQSMGSLRVGHDWVTSLSLSGYLFSLNQGWVLIQSFYWGRIHFLTPIVIGSIQFLAVIRLKALVLACCLPESTCSASACTVYQLGWFLPVSQQGNNCSKRDATTLYSIAM